MPDVMDDMTAKPTPEEIIHTWRRAHYKAMTADALHPGSPIKALADAGYRIIHEDDIGKVPVRVVERVPFKIEED